MELICDYFVRPELRLHSILAEKLVLASGRFYKIQPTPEHYDFLSWSFLIYVVMYILRSNLPEGRLTVMNF